VRVLEAAGLEVALVTGRKCCGRPAASRGLLAEVRRLGEHNLRLLAGSTEPVVFLEPSCYSIFVDEYRQLGLPGADDVATRCVLIEDLVVELLDDAGDDLLPWSDQTTVVAVHGHCHTKALADPSRTLELLRRIPGATVVPLDTGCCGMAGAFGMLAANQELSRAVAKPLVHAIRTLPPGAEVAAAGTSCRHQIELLTGVPARHPVEIVVNALRSI
jgi:Fe-S oxidoreductase